MKLKHMIAAPIAAAALVAGTAGAALASNRVDDNVSTLTSTTGHEQWKWVNGGHEVVDNQVFSPPTKNVLSNTNDGPNFKLIHSYTPVYNWNAWPTIFYGDWMGVKAQHGLLPAKVSSIHSLWLTDRTSFPKNAVGNDAMDFWYNKTSDALHHPDGAEIMIWVRWQHVGGANQQLVKFPGHRFYFEHWRTCQDGTCWNYLQFRLYKQSDNFTNFNAEILVHYCEEHGWLSSHWYNTADDNGFEDVQNMQGAGISKFTIRDF
jgi:hypothetical protein